MSLLALGLGGAALGALGGMMPSKQESQTRLEMAPESQLEKDISSRLPGQLQGLESLIGLGAGSSDVTAGVEAQRGLAGLLESLQSTSGLPNEKDIMEAQRFGSQVFQPQRVALEQGFLKEEQRVAQLAAQLGRPVNDPILQAKLAESKMNQFGQLEAQQGAFSAQEARRLPQQRLNLAEQLAGVRGGLATQAMQNRMTLLGLGQNLLQNERNFRVASATRNTTGQSGGGLQGAITGALGGASLGVRAFNAFSGGGGGGAAAPTTSAANFGSNFGQFRPIG